jgi:glycosyltransferase involved in cell wall biosynthesis
MNLADVFCLPSITEGWPNVVVEALACGSPTVASNVGGVPEIITNPEYGIIVPPCNSERLAEGLEKAIRKPWNKNTIRNAVKNRTWENVAMELLEEIRGVIKQ